MHFQLSTAEESRRHSRIKFLNKLVITPLSNTNLVANDMAIIRFYLNQRERQEGTHALKLNVHINHAAMRKDIELIKKEYY